ncbi:MAG: S8 family peptidase [Proteobacteria bacterium]|nr:S8 family peptidase [Pseudomonadota bacterium]
MDNLKVPFIKMLKTLLIFWSTLVVSAERYLVVPKDTISKLVTCVHNMEVVSEAFGIYSVSRTDLMVDWRGFDSCFYIEPDAEVKSLTVPWHLERITNAAPVYNNTVYKYNTKGSCHTGSTQINTYVLDTGIDIWNPQFGGRAQFVANFADDKDLDCQGHGTHVAGLIGSHDYGVCVDARLFAVKVLDCNGSGSLSGVIRGIDYVARNARGKPNVKSIINMSLGGGYSRALNKAVDDAVKSSCDLYIVAAAGNENMDACTGSPSSAEHAFTVMASDKGDNRAWFSNYGKCATVYSPGVDVLSTIPGNKTAVYSGTSMATPITVGILNHFIDMFPNLPNYKVLALLVKNAIKVVKGRKYNLAKLVHLDRNVNGERVFAEKQI